MRAFLLSLIVIFGFADIGHTADANARPEPVRYDRGVIAADPFAGPFIGLGVGAQATDITISTPYSGDFSGISADGFTASVHGGWNFGGGLLYFGPEVELGTGDANVEFGPFGDILEMETFANLVATAKWRFNPSAYAGIRGGYELQYWSAIGNTDIETGWWLVGGELGASVAPGVTVKVTADYLMLDEVEIDGATAATNDAITDVLEETDAFRVQLRGSYHFGGGVSPLEALAR